jgi:hypothetical protein
LVLGVSWPPAHGWRRLVDGRLITQAARLEFETSGRQRGGLPSVINGVRIV